MYQNRHPTKENIFHSAGWLFADLLLVLMIIFMAASTTGKPKPAPLPRTLNPNPLNFTINADPHQLKKAKTIAYIKDRVLQKLKQSHKSNSEVGLVLTFAGTADGEKNASVFNAILKTLPAFRHAVCNNYHYLGHPASRFDLQFYFLE